MTERQYHGALNDHLIRTYPDSDFALQINQPNWKPTTPMQEIYLKHARECTEKFDMTNYNNHNYWMRVSPRRPMMNASFTKLNDGVLPPGPKLLLFATFALPVTFVVDIHPLLKGWVKRLHNMWHGNIYQRVVDIPKWSFLHTATVNRMGVIYVGARFVCRMFQLTREQSYLVSSWVALYLTLPVFYRWARIGIPTAWCFGSYLLYKYLEHHGKINVLGIRRGRRSRELYAMKTTRFRARTAEERLVKGNSTGLLSKFFHFHTKDAQPGRKARLHGSYGRKKFGPNLNWFGARDRYDQNYHEENKLRGYFHPSGRSKLRADKFNPYPEWYYGKFANRPSLDYEMERNKPNTRDRAWYNLDNLRNNEGVKMEQPRAWDLRRRELESVKILDHYLDDKFWANPNKPVHGQASHLFEHYLEKGDPYFF